MNQRVLVFESDTAFADDIKRNFERMGLAVDLALDGPTGLELATSHRPDLILLAIELPGMNGFLVCKKIKKIAELERVPLVILSSEVDQETFEQHKKLRTRADEYIRKPIAFGELLDRIRGYVPMNGHAHNVLGENTAVDIEEAFSVNDDEVIVLSDDDAQPHDPMESLEMSGGASDPEAGLELAPPPFAAGDAIEAPPMAAAMPEPIMATPLAAAPAPSAATPAPAPRSPLPPFSLRAPTESAVQAAAHAAEIERLKRELASADEKAQASERRAALAEQRATGAEKSLDAAKRTGGASSRELLDLREQLNRKDRELLELRDQVTARDKQLIEASDRNLSTERELQDSRDKISDLQRDLEKKSELVVALSGDKETARKRLDDAKARAERNEAKVRELSAELDELRVQQQSELVELNNQRTQAEASLRAEHASAVEQLKAQHAAELEASQARHASEIAQLTQSQSAALTALRGEHAARMAEAQRTHEEDLSELREEHVVSQKSAAERAEGEKLTALEAQREELTSAHSERLADVERQLRAEHALMRDDAAQRHATELAEQADRHKQEASRLTKTINDVEARFALLEERFEESEKGRTTAETDLKGVREERDHLSARSTELASQLGRAQARLARDHELIERVRKAMAIGLGLLEEQKQDPPG
jgi:CheY-like chemotaxis protein